MTTVTQPEALRLALAALESCNPGDTSSGHVIYPSFDEDAVSAAIEAVESALTSHAGLTGGRTLRRRRKMAHGSNYGASRGKRSAAWTL